MMSKTIIQNILFQESRIFQENLIKKERLIRNTSEDPFEYNVRLSKLHIIGGLSICQNSEFDDNYTIGSLSLLSGFINLRLSSPHFSSCH